MKNFINKNWKNFFLIIGVIFIIIDLFYIITSPATIPQDFLEYGPNIESDIFDGTKEITDEVVNSEPESSENDIVSNVANTTGMSPDLAKGLLVFAFCFIIILVLSSVLEGSSGGNKKKK